MKRLLIGFVVLAAACNREDQPEAPTPAEAERLNEAEEMLNELANEEGGEAPTPSNQSE